jgi:tetratricopeptide (TPR) repeat protein
MQRLRACLFLVIVSAVSGATSTSEVSELLQQGQVLQSQGQFIEAEQRFQAAVNKANAVSQPSTAQVAALANLANVEIDLGRTDTAARLYNRGIGILRNGNTGNTLLIEELSLRLAELYLEAGQAATAGKLVDRVIGSQQSRHASPRWADAFARDLRAGVYAYQKKLPQAERMEREAISIFDALNCRNDPEYGVAMVHLAMFLNLRKHPADALPYAQRALATLSAIPVRPVIIEADAKITLASIYSRLGRAGEARASVQEARAMVEDHYGPDHPSTGRVLLAEAAVLRTIGEKTTARIAQARGRKILAAGATIGVTATVPALVALTP